MLGQLGDRSWRCGDIKGQRRAAGLAGPGRLWLSKPFQLKLPPAFHLGCGPSFSAAMTLAMRFF